VTGVQTCALPIFDTLVIEPNEKKVSCVYRLLLPVEPTARVLEARLIFKDPQAGHHERNTGGRGQSEGRQRAGMTRGAGHG
jgi:hypothetical protein